MDIFDKIAVAPEFISQLVAETEQKISEQGPNQKRRPYDESLWGDEDKELGGTPFLNFSLWGDMESPIGVGVEHLWIPPNLRGEGIGQRIYEEFEKNLPESVEFVTLKACSLGSGHSKTFWAERGFTPVFEMTGVEIAPEAGIHMHKGVNGHPTPSTAPYDEDLYDFFEPPYLKAKLQQAEVFESEKPTRKRNFSP